MEGHWHAWTELKHFFYLLVAILFWSPKKMAGIVGLPRMFWYCHWQNEEHNNKVALWWNEKHDNKANEDCTTTKLWYNEMTYGKTKTGRQNKLMVCIVFTALVQSPSCVIILLLAEFALDSTRWILTPSLYPTVNTLYWYSWYVIYAWLIWHIYWPARMIRCRNWG